jgi:hypothetical protein
MFYLDRPMMFVPATEACESIAVGEASSKKLKLESAQRKDL